MTAMTAMTAVAAVPTALKDLRPTARSGHSGLRERLGLSAYDRYVSGRGCSLGPFRLGFFSPLFHAHAHPPTELFRARRRP